jgi:hypothetical protein
LLQRHELIWFVSASFLPLFPYAKLHNLRLVTVNLRDYPGSSPLDSRELVNLRSQEPDTQAGVIREQALEIATFLVRFIEAEGIPAPKCIASGSDKEVGGISLVAWSQGNAFLLSLLSNIALLDARTDALLERYLRVVFMYGEAQSLLSSMRQMTH